MPYNDSIFQLRGKYAKTFKDIPVNEANTSICDENNDTGANESIISQDEVKTEHFKVYKIKYTINVLPGLINRGGDE